jgi:4,5:9,10-diseco-3-hydroxy-5,9,17-trioxoandrosta-1(10),2-diene-4-oate hydrolase
VTTLNKTRADANPKAPTHASTREAGALSAALLIYAVALVYWSSGLTWPANDTYDLSRALLGMGVDFQPSILLPLAGLVIVAAISVQARVRLGRRHRLYWLWQTGTFVLTIGLLLRGILGLLWAVPALGHTAPPFFTLNVIYTLIALGLGWCGVRVLRSDAPRHGAWTIGAVGVPVAMVGLVATVAYAGPLPSADQDVPIHALGPATSEYVETPLAQFHYLTAGSGSPVVLLAPGASWSAAWLPQIRELARQHTVYAVDLPGHGYSQLADGAFTYDLDGMTDAVHEFLTALELDRVSLAGHSWSGGWALAYAQAHPDRVDRLVLLAPSGLDEPDPLDWEMLKLPVIGRALAVAGSMSTTSVEAGLRELAEHPIDDDVIDRLAVPSRFRDNVVAMHELEARLDWRVTENALTSTHVPTLVVWGREDNLLPVANATRFGDLLPDVRVQTLAGCGHGLTIDCPDEVTDAMKEFLHDQ